MWISSATSDTTRSRIRSPFAKESFWMPPCGWPFTTRMVLTAAGAAVDADVDAVPASPDAAVLDEVDDPLEPPLSPPGRRSTKPTIRTTTVAARMPRRCAVVMARHSGGLVVVAAPGHARSRAAAPAPRPPRVSRSLRRTGARGHEVRPHPGPPRRLAARRGRAAGGLLAGQAARHDAAAAARPRAGAAGGRPRRAAPRRPRRGARLPRT